MKSRIAVVVGSILIALGIIFFGTMNNLWHFDWRYVALLGPIALISVGIWMLWPHRAWNIWIAPVVIVLVGGLVFVVPQAHDRFIGESTLLQTEQANQLSLDVDVDNSNVTVGTLSNSSALYNASAQGFRISENFTLQNGSAKSALSTLRPPLTGNGSGQFDLAINPSTLLTLSLDLNNSKGTIDLSGLNLQSLELDGGSEGTAVTLGTASFSQNVKIDDSNSRITLNIPKEAALQLISEDSDDLLPGSFGYLGLKQQANALVSPDFDTNPIRITIILDDNASSTTIVRY